MKEIILPKRIYMEELISVLKLNDMPTIRALKTILLYARHDGLPIIFDDTVLGIDASVPIGPQSDDLGNAIGCEFAGQDKLQELDGPKTVYAAYAYRPEEDKYRLWVNSFYQDNVLYFVPHESGADLTQLDLGWDSFYCDRDQLWEFISTMENPSKTDTKATTNRQTDKKNPPCEPAWKALALLAREKAEQFDRYKSGDKVNASAFKDHIVDLAKKHEISDYGLISIDDKISAALKKSDLKRIK